MAKRTYTILHTESSLGWGGQEHRVLAEAKIMRQRGHRLLLACDPRGALYPRAERQGFDSISLEFRRPAQCRRLAPTCGGSSSKPGWTY